MRVWKGGPKNGLQTGPRVPGSHMRRIHMARNGVQLLPRTPTTVMTFCTSVSSTIRYCDIACLTAGSVVWP